MNAPQVADRDTELSWRLGIFSQLLEHPTWPDLSASALNESRVYRGQAGIWADLSRTSSIMEPGVAVSVLHTGRHYADDINEDGIVYHYPTTHRGARADINEVQAVKNAQALGLPIFVVSQHGPSRRIQKSWVTGFDDAARVFLIEFGEEPPESLAVEIDGSEPFERRVRRDLTIAQVQRRNRNPRFKFEAIRRYENRCVVTGTNVVQMLDAAHVIPVENGGSDDPRNSLLLSASAHRAFDARLWAIHPSTLQVEAKVDGPSLSRMKIINTDLASLKRLPHKDALEWRYEHYLGRIGV